MADDSENISKEKSKEIANTENEQNAEDVNRAGASYYHREVILDRPREELEGSEDKGAPRSQFDDAEDTESRSTDSQFTNSEKQTTVFSCQVDHSGTVVNGRGWIAVGSKKPPVIILHDLGQDLGMYRFAAHGMVDAGFSTYAFDLRGHGRSGRRLGHIPKFELLVKDLLQVVAWVRQKEGGRSPIIMGQGVGALIATYFQADFPKYCKGVVLLSPCFRLRSPLSRSRRLMVKAMAEVTPKVRLPAAMTPMFSSNVHDDKTSIIQNLTHQAYPGITANFAYELMAAMDGIKKPLKKVSRPTLIMIPKDDPVCEYDDLETLVGVNGSSHCIYLDVEGHQILTRSREDLEGIFEHLLPWLNKVS